MEAIRRGLGAGVVCLDELTSLGSGLGCLAVCEIPMMGVTRVNTEIMNAEKGLV
jgi:hypothetical protein